MRILGVDPGTRTVGYGVLDVAINTFAYVECGLLRARASTAMHNRLHELANGLAEVIQQYRPNVLALERAFHGKNASSALALGLARGAIMLIAAQHELDVVEYSPAHVKRAVVGRGAATKADVQGRVALLCGLRKLPATDAADALALAICHGNRMTIYPRDTRVVARKRIDHAARQP